MMNGSLDIDDPSIIHPGSCNDSIRKIYPSKAELSVINNFIRCTEDECIEVFTSYSNLNLHLYKSHNKKDAIQFDSTVKQFHCPEIQCIYHHSQWFKNKKLLKQHYLKVHSPKSYICEKCQQGFPTEAFKNLHVDYCGVKFKCSDCPISYPKYESLLTHARRKEHKINDKIYFKLKKCAVDKKNTSISDNRVLNKIRPVLPKATTNIQLVLVTDRKGTNKKNDRCIQTDHIPQKHGGKFVQINQNSIKLCRGTQQTQTRVRKGCSNIETQTVGDFFREKKNCEDKKFITTQSSTQTTIIPSLNNFLPVNNLGLSVPNLRKSCSTHTLKHEQDKNYSSTVNTHETINSNASDDLIENNLATFDTNFFNCNMETQTDSIFNEDLFAYGDYYSNMYTQTCEDLFLNSLQLNHIETQTVDDMLKSVEIQTMPNKTQLNCRDINDMETQTDLEFQQMLEAIDV